MSHTQEPAPPVNGLPTRWPWKDLADALERADDAKQRKHRAEVADDRNAREKATLDEWQAMADREATRREWADFIIGGLRVLLADGRSADLAELLNPAMVEIVKRLDEVEWAVARLERGNR